MGTKDCPYGVPAPLDANGRLVPLDTKELVYRGETRDVYSFLYSIRIKCWFVEFWEGVDICVSSCTLPDSRESLEEDAKKAPRFCPFCGKELGLDEH